MVWFLQLLLWRKKSGFKLERNKDLTYRPALHQIQTEFEMQHREFWERPFNLPLTI